jgi:hypothetical protein
MNREEIVSSSVEKEFFSSQQPVAQEREFFGSPKIYDILGNNNTPKKDVDYINNSKKKNNVRYY